MQEPFLTFYQKLKKNPQLADFGLWLAHGDEPLTQDWLLDSLRANWQARSLSIKRFELTSVQSWQSVLGELNSLSLFDDGEAILLTGNHKPDKTTQAQLEAFAQRSQAGDTQNVLFWQTSKLDKNAQNSKWIAPFLQSGKVIDTHIYNESQRQNLLQIKAAEIGLNLDPDAWQLLLLQTQNHLLGAYQSLWRLYYLFLPAILQNAPNPIAIDSHQLQDALISQSNYSVFDLSDAILLGDPKKVIHIFDQLKQNEEPTTLILWAIEKDMKLIEQLKQGKDPQSLGIWRNKQTLYQQASRRQTSQSIAQWPDLLFQCDQAIKGVIAQPAWEILLQTALQVCGYKLFAKP